eukprot:gene46795-62606_t
MIRRMYQALRASRSEFVPVRNLSYHVRVWGERSDAVTPLVLVHGWMDVAASWQFVVDAMRDERWIIAPDWRGFGLTGGGGADCYWHPDYLADLDFLLDHYVPDQAVNLVGHSMGGGVAMQYAGVRPERVRRLVNLEGFGMKSTTPDQAPARYAKWMDELLEPQEMRGYADLGEVAKRLQKTNPRLSDLRIAGTRIASVNPAVRIDLGGYAK